MNPNFRVTYDIVTPESAEHGDAEERGFVLPGNWHVSTEDCRRDPEQSHNMTLREALNLCNPSENSGRWWSDTGEIYDYTTNETESRSIHPPANITESSYRRITRLMGIRVR